MCGIFEFICWYLPVGKQGSLFIEKIGTEGGREIRVSGNQEVGYQKIRVSGE
jgi:hypothetical protein